MDHCGLCGSVECSGIPGDPKSCMPGPFEEYEPEEGPMFELEYKNLMLEGDISWNLWTFGFEYDQTGPKISQDRAQFYILHLGPLVVMLSRYRNG